MVRYLLRRTLTAIVVVLGVAFVTFLLLHVIAPSPGRATLGLRATAAAVRAYNKAHGYTEPFILQFLSYLIQLAHGNLGFSVTLNQSVAALIAERAPLSAFLSGTALVLAITVAVPLGIYQGVKRNGFGDHVLTMATFILWSMPIFLFGALLIQIFVFGLHWVNANVPQSQTLSGALTDFKDLILPITALTLTNIATYSRYQRSSTLDVLAQDYIRVAQAKGLPQRLVLLRHLVRNSALPLVTLIGLSIPALLAGNLLIEALFNINGLGLLFVTSLQRQDFPVLLAYTLIGATLTVLGNLVADIALTVADPRIRLA